ncbi:MAG: glucosamine-6-phosphate deaminase [Acidobacteriaceae bacterium]
MDKGNFRVDKLRVEVYADAQAAGRAAAQATAQAMRELVAQRGSTAVVFATGASQLDALAAIVEEPNIPWNRIDGFHLDEYLGLPVEHPASFRHYLRENLTSRTQMRSFLEIDGESGDPEAVCRRYAEALREANPQLCLLGIGENGHLAFNDPGEADFQDRDDVKVVQLDEACRQQQAAEGWFPGSEDVPERAITLTIPAILRVPRLIVCVPGIRKAQIVRRTLHEPVSLHCPATILRTHPNATLYLDRDSASELTASTELQART